jgi:hypothetical protein
MNSIVRWLMVVALTLFAVDNIHAGAMLLHIGSATPRVAQRGTIVEVVIQGICINDPREIIFYRPGIKAISIESMPKLPVPIGLVHGGRMEEQVRCKFEIAPDCVPGEHPFRMRTATQISSLGLFHVSVFPVIDENEKGSNANDTIETAMAVTPNITVRGWIKGGSRGDVDMYRVPAKAGTRLSVELDAVRIADRHYGGSEYDLAVRILDESGKELASNDDNPLHLQDPVVSAKLPRDGVAYVEVRRSVFMSADCPYCVHIGNNKRPLIAYPPGGQTGTNQKMQLIGDPLGTFEETIAIPSVTGTFEYFGDAPSPLVLRSSAYPNLLEDSVASETKIPQLPIALNGIIETRDDTDTYRMAVKKGDRFRIRVYAASLGSPIDPFIRIRPLSATGEVGAPELESDDSTVNDRDVFGTSFRSRGGLKDILDPSVIWEAKTTGDYLFEIEDRSGNGGPTAIYRIEIETPPNAVYTLLASTAFDWTECIRTSGLAVAQGNRIAVNINLPQGFGSTFKGELELVAHGLPQGVRMVSSKVPAGRGVWPVQFIAESSAKQCAALISIEAKPVDASQKLISSSQQSIPYLNHSGGDAWRTVQLDKFVLAVTDPAPYSIEIKPPQVPLVRGGELSIPVKITRHNGFAGPVEFLCDWIPSGVGIQPATTIPAGETEAVLRISGDANAPLGLCPIVVVANNIREELDSYLGTGRIRVASEVVNITIAEPFVELSSQPESIRRGAKGKYVWTVVHKSPFEGTAKVKLLGLPKGVNLLEPMPVLTRESKEITFQIEATDEALLGSVRGVSCEVMVQAGSQEIRQRTGSATLRIDPK